MPDIDARQLDVVLTALGEQLAAAEENVHLVVIGGSGLLELGLPAGFTDRLIERDHGPALRVSFASRIDQIFFKLYAAADRREPRDFADLQQLAPTPAELRAGARWARTHNMPGPFDVALARALADLGVEDDGRDA